MDRTFILALGIATCMFLHPAGIKAQDSTKASGEKAVPLKTKPVKNTFESVWIIDDQTVMVPVKGSFEMDIQHRFGTVNHGYSDFWGLFASSQIRLGVSYVPVSNLNIGIGLDKYNELVDGSAKYAILKQTRGKFPVSITYYGILGVDTRSDPDHSLYPRETDRIASFNQIIIARKFTDKLSLQVSPSLSHQNSVSGFYTKHDSTGTAIFEDMKHDHFALAIAGRYKIGPSTAIIVDYDQPVTHHPTDNPSPNVAFGFEFSTSGHTFQVFMGNYSYLNPEKNNLFNSNSAFNYTQADGTKIKGGMFVIGFNITRLWNF